MHRQGVSARDLSDLYVLVERQYPRVSYDTVSNPTTLPHWFDAVAFEKKAAADTLFRAYPVDIAMATVREHPGPV